MGAAAAVPLITMAVGAGVNYYNTQRTMRRQDEALAAQIAQQRERQRVADAAVQNTVQQVAGSSPDAQRQQALNDYLTQLQRTAGNATAGLQGIGAVSDRFTDDAAAAGAELHELGGRTADILSRIDAPIRQRQDEGIQFGRLGSDIARVGALSDSDRYLGEIRMRGIRRNPWLDAVSQAATGYATNYSTGSTAWPSSGGGDLNWAAFGGRAPLG
jgi:hypothetical protein